MLTYGGPCAMESKSLYINSFFGDPWDPMRHRDPWDGSRMQSRTQRRMQSRMQRRMQSRGSALGSGLIHVVTQSLIIYVYIHDTSMIRFNDGAEGGAPGGGRAEIPKLCHGQTLFAVTIVSSICSPTKSSTYVRLLAAQHVPNFLRTKPAKAAHRWAWTIDQLAAD